MISIATAAPVAKKAPADCVRVMIVDDSSVIRGLLTRTLEGQPGIAVVASAGNGQMALAGLARAEVDVIVLDIEMPVMDGLTALPRLIAAAPGVKVIMASTLTQKNAAVSIQAMAAGAADYIPKPTTTLAIAAADEFKRELVAKVLALGAGRVRGRGASLPAGAVPSRAAASLPRPGQKIALRAPSRFATRIIAIGSSTGGPQALTKVLGGIPADVTQPILITQHMPPTFTTILAEHAAKAARRPAAEARDGEAIRPGRIFVAPGDFHMVVSKQGESAVVRLTRDPPENFCRPAVDPMLRSIAQAYGPGTLAVILTGMGSDGAKGGEVVSDAGGTVVAQDEATSVVWGMPGATAATGCCAAVLPVDEIAPWVTKLARSRAQ